MHENFNGLLFDGTIMLIYHQSVYIDKIFPFLSILNYIGMGKFLHLEPKEFMTQQGFAIKKSDRKIWEKEIKVMIGSAW